MYVCTMLHFEKQSTVAIAHTHTRRAASTTTDEKLLPTHYLPLFTHFTTLPTVIQIVTRHKAISISLNDLSTIFLRMVTVPALGFVLNFIQ